MTTIFATDVRQPTLLPQDPLGVRLCELFPYLWNTIAAPNEVKPAWETLNKYPLRPRVLWQQWQDRTKLVGVRFGTDTQYGLLDIDRQSPYHPAQDPEGLTMLRAALETIGIYRTVLITSSASGGLHLYIPLPYAVPTFGLASALKQCLEAQDFTVGPGQLEIFPNTKAYGFAGEFIEYNAHRLPLQPASGSVLLNEDGNPLSSDLGRFLGTWDWAASGQSLEEVRTAIAIARSNGNKRRRRRLTIVEDWRQDLQTEINAGWTGYGQTNAFLKTIACYAVVFERLSGEGLANFVHDTAMNAPGYADYCRHQHEIRRRATVWARATEKYYWPLGTEPKREGSLTNEAGGNPVIAINQNAQRALDAQRRIREAVEQLTNADQLPDEVTLRKTMLVQQGISARTLYKYPELWHPVYQETVAATIGGVGQPDPLGEDATDLALPMGEGVNSLEPPQSGKVYTLESKMKCVVLDFLPLGPQCSFSELPSAPGTVLISQGIPRRPWLTKSVTTGLDETSLKAIAAQDGDRCLIDIEVPSLPWSHDSVIDP